MGATATCRYYSLGSCTKRDCTFAHDRDGEKPVCRYYQQGECRFGNFCAFQHTKVRPPTTTTATATAATGAKFGVASAPCVPSAQAPTSPATSTPTPAALRTASFSSAPSPSAAAAGPSSADRPVRPPVPIKFAAPARTTVPVKTATPPPTTSIPAKRVLSTRPLISSSAGLSSATQFLRSAQKSPQNTDIQTDLADRMNRVGISTSTPRYEDDDDAEHYFRNPDVIYGVHDTISTSDPESPPSSPEPTDFSYSSIARSNVLIPDGVEAFYPSKHHEGDAQPEEREPLCPFAMQGRCRYGEHCRYRHGDACPVCGKMCLDPLDGVEVHQEHIKQCEQEQHNRVDLAAAASASEEMDCVVCMETVLQKPDPRFGLLDCEHCVCLDCIRKWRTNERMDTAKSCPICRTTTHVVTPSTTWPLTPHHKQSIIQTYKSRLNTIDCKHYAHGTGTCPFGTSCLYRHVGVDGVEEKVRLRRVVGAGGEEQGEEVRILGGVMLVDFLERWEGRR